MQIDENSPSDHQRGFVGGLATVYYKSNMAADAMQRHFDMLKGFGVDHECDRQTDGQVAVSNSAL